MSITFVIELGYNGDVSSVISNGSKKENIQKLKDIINRLRKPEVLYQLGIAAVCFIIDNVSGEEKTKLFGDVEKKGYESIRLMIQEKYKQYLPESTDASILVEDVPDSLEESENVKIRLTCSGGGNWRFVSELCARTFVKKVYDTAFNAGLELNILAV